jgi:hypothetical protein
LPGLANELFALEPGRGAFCFLAQAFCLLRQALIERGVFLETPSLHGAAPFLEEAGAQLAFSSPMKATDRAVIGAIWHDRPPTCWSKQLTPQNR